MSLKEIARRVIVYANAHTEREKFQLESFVGVEKASYFSLNARERYSNEPMTDNNRSLQTYTPALM